MENFLKKFSTTPKSYFFCNTYSEILFYAIFVIFKGTKLDMVKQVEAAEKLAKIEADFIRVRGEVDLSNNKFVEQNRRTVNIEGDISELIVSKDLFQMKLTASETECIELRGKTEELGRTVTNQSSKIERMERQIKKANEELREMTETLDSRTLQLAKEKRENEANANFIERMKIEMEMVSLAFEN